MVGGERGEGWAKSAGGGWVSGRSALGVRGGPRVLQWEDADLGAESPLRLVL